MDRSPSEWLAFPSESILPLPKKALPFINSTGRRGRGLLCKSGAWRVSVLLATRHDGDFIYRGNVGSGFSKSAIEDVSRRLLALERAAPVVADVPTMRAKIHWVEPVLEAEVRYVDRTKSGRLRIPTFVKLRSNLEKPTAQPASAPDKPMKNELIDLLDSAGENLTMEIEGHEVRLTHLDKELWPRSDVGPAVTKRDLLRYYLSVAPFILPHLLDRPLAFVRYPEGLNGPHFFQKHLAAGVPDYMQTVDIYSSTNARADRYLLVDGLAPLLWLAQMGALEIHPWQSSITPIKGVGGHFKTADSLAASVLNRPDFMVLDLDPYTYSGKEAPNAEPELNKKGWKQVVAAAQRLRETMDQLSYTTYLKTSGKTGLHLFVPIERRYDYDEVREVAKTLGEHLMRRNPELITMEWSVKKRPAKVFFDFGQN